MRRVVVYLLKGERKCASRLYIIQIISVIVCTCAGVVRGKVVEATAFISCGG